MQYWWDCFFNMPLQRVWKSDFHRREVTNNGSNSVSGDKTLEHDLINMKMKENDQLHGDWQWSTATALHDIFKIKKENNHTIRQHENLLFYQMDYPLS